MVEVTLRLRSAALFNPVYEIVDAGRIHFPLEVCALFKFVGVIPATLGYFKEKSAVFFARHVCTFNHLVEFCKKHVLSLVCLFLLLLVPLLLILLFVVVRAVVLGYLFGLLTNFWIISIRVTIN